MGSDPLDQLEKWARKAERRASRAYRFSRLRSALRRPFRPGLFRSRWFRPRRLLPLVMVVAFAVLLWFTRDSWTRWDHNQPVAVSRTASVSPGSAGPFDGTPAVSFDQGEAGIVIPDATNVDGWDVRQVGAALDQVRRALIVTYLDHRVLVGHDPTPLQELLASNSWKDTPPLVRISRSVELSADAPRIKGTTIVRGTASDGALEIVTNYVVVYAFDVSDRGVASRIAGVHSQVTWRVYDSSEYLSEDSGLWLYQSKGYKFNIDCDEAEQGLLAPPQDINGDRPLWDTEDPDKAYDPNRGLDVEDTCK